MTTYQIDISQEDEKGNVQNFFYQKFIDQREWFKVREVIRIINEFEQDRPKITGLPWLSVGELNDLTDQAQKLAKATGNSLNHELAILINIWFKERV
ncbi:hypothetical protein UFOVP599_32 [uncultured Caudovirales phage]|uniref:Uncharacterized protein n=1 Tax=uncultured Caudovirales phage TaxID=2100421 RepID=A0A6J5N0A9_9CAUD|nr:hypothetical protein UFOVP599_32 [uncultured Caudovirales phage]